MKIKALKIFSCSTGVLLLLTGCTSTLVVNSHRQKEGLMEAYRAGNNQHAQELIEERLTAEGWSSEVGAQDELMWRLEAGMIHFHQGHYQEAIQEFRHAEKLIAAYDRRAQISIRDGGEEIGAALTNMNTLPYRGFCRDRIALSIYKSLAYLGRKNPNAFRGQLNRLRQTQKQVRHNYEELFKAAQAEVEKIKKSDAETAKKIEQTKENFSEKKLTESTDNAEFTAGLQETRRVAHRGYGNFLNPAAIFLSGLGYLLDERYDNARVEFQKIYEAMPYNPLTQTYYASALRATGRGMSPRLRQVTPLDFERQNYVYVLVGTGVSAAFKQIALYFPIMTAWPMCEFYPAPFKRFQVVADHQRYASGLLADMDGILAQEFNERLPLMITRIAISTALKEGAKYAATWGTAQADALSAGLVFVGMTIYNTATNTADTRSWEILPKEFHLAQFPMPQDRKISLELQGDQRAVRKILLPGNCRNALIYVSAPSRENIKCHTFALP